MGRLVVEALAEQDGAGLDFDRRVGVAVEDAREGGALELDGARCAAVPPGRSLWSRQPGLTHLRFLTS